MGAPRKPRGPRAHRHQHGPQRRVGRIDWRPKAEPSDQAPWEKPQAAAASTPAEVPSSFAPRIDPRQSGLGDLPALGPSDTPEFLPPR